MNTLNGKSTGLRPVMDVGNMNLKNNGETTENNHTDRDSS